MKSTIRQESHEDYNSVEKVIEAAFKNEVKSDQTEHFLVARLRKSAAIIPGLTLVAVLENQIVGHILLSKISINNENNKTASLALAPVSVHPDFQRKGIGSQLIESAHAIAQKQGFKSIVLIGHENYYPRFGYQQTAKYGIQLPFEAPKENCMVIELVEDGLNGVHGIVEYSPVFFE